MCAQNTSHFANCITCENINALTYCSVGNVGNVGNVPYYTSAVNYLKAICTVQGRPMLDCCCLHMSVHTFHIFHAIYLLYILKFDHHTLQLRAHRHCSLHCKPT